MSWDRKDRPAQEQDPSSAREPVRPVAPGRVTLTGKLSEGTAPARQRRPIGPPPGPAPVQRTAARDADIDRWMDAAHRGGHDLRYYENVLLSVNRAKGRAGIRGTFQDPGVLGGGANNVQLEAGRRIWLVSPAYARSLEGQVPDGSLTGGMHARARRVLGHIDDLVQSVTDSPQHFGAVAGEYADAIKDHLPEIIGITAGFILAESASAFLAATPTGVGQLAAAVIQLGLAAFGATIAVDACGQARQHGEQWLTLAWTAHGDAGELAAASQAFLKMLVSIAMAALTIAGVRGNMAKGLKIADAIKIRPPTLGWSAMATADGAAVAGGPVFTPGSITSAGPVDIGPSLMSATGAGAGKASQDTEALASTETPGKAEDVAKPAKGQVPYGKNAEEKLRKHSQHIRETARQLGVEVPKKPDARRRSPPWMVSSPK